MGGDRIADEADLYSRYLVNLPATPEVITLFRSAILSLRATSDSADVYVAFVLENQWGLGSLDAALAIVSPNSPLRQRLRIMFAILETQPQFAAEFGTFNHTASDVVRVIGALIRSALQLAIGLALVGVSRMRR